MRGRPLGAHWRAVLVKFDPAVLMVVECVLGAHMHTAFIRADLAVIGMGGRVLDARELAFLIEEADLAMIGMGGRVLFARELAVLRPASAR